MTPNEQIIEQALAHILTPGTLPDTIRWTIACAMDSAVKAAAPDLLRECDEARAEVVRLEPGR